MFSPMKENVAVLMDKIREILRSHEGILGVVPVFCENINTCHRDGICRLSLGGRLINVQSDLDYPDQLDVWAKSIVGQLFPELSL